MLGLGEAGADLLTDGAVQPGVRDGAFPPGQKRVLLGQAGERAALEGVGLGVFYACLDLALVPRHRRLRRQQRGAVMLAKGAELWVELRIEPVGLEHRGFQVVRHERGGDAAKVSKGVLQTTNERLGVLSPHDLAVALARVTEHGAEKVRPAAPPALLGDPGTLAEVDLHLLAGRTLHPAERQRVDLHQAAHEAFDRAVGATEAMGAHQILINALGRQAGLHPGLNLCGQRLAEAHRTGVRADGQVRGWFWRRIARGAVGRVTGWF